MRSYVQVVALCLAIYPERPGVRTWDLSRPMGLERQVIHPMRQVETI